MNPVNSRIIKQATIAIIFLFIVISVGYFSYQKLSSVENPCSEGVDCDNVCGKPCQAVKPLEVADKKLISVALAVPSSGSTVWDYDVLIEFKNPNFSQGADGAYELNLFDNSGELVFSKNGSFYILPGERKFILDSPIRTDNEVTDIDLILVEPQWQELKNYSGEPFFSSQRREYEVLQRPGEFSRLQGIIFNNSGLNFDKVDIVAVLYGPSTISGQAADEILAAGKTDLRSFESKTERFFEIKWPLRFEGAVQRIDVQAYTNILDESNILKGEESQQQF